MGAWLSLWVTTVAGTVLSATEFSLFFVVVTTLTPLTPKTNVTFAANLFGASRTDIP